jgi:DNA (cytosine-5)-methyltransferase 1
MKGFSYFSLIDLFSGCGGLSLGLERSGFKPVLFCEVNPDAAETYLENRKCGEIISIGDIYSLSDEKLETFKAVWSKKGMDDIDLVAGGPPCQGFSGIGHRRTFTSLEKKDIPSNHLFQEMARVVRCVRPKMFLFENVRGLLNSKWSKDGNNGEIFEAILAEFSGIEGYSIKWDLVHARDYGVPQNRPRVIMVGIREDVLPARLGNKWTIPCITNPSAVRDGFLPLPGEEPPSLEELLSDLIDNDYSKKIATTEYPTEPLNYIQKTLRTLPNGKTLGKGAKLTCQEYIRHAPRIQQKFKYMIENNGEIPVEFKTKKFAQRVLPRNWDSAGPNITATSLPEDYVHFSQPRVPTVREWARLQTFPDWYNFCGRRTTGGRRRAGDPEKGLWNRDVPMYTQIGNAVPVLLAERIGSHLASLLSK